METIIFTDNKRLSTDYCADKTLFAQKIDVNHILNTEVYQSHISKVRFWVVRTNLPNQQNLILEVCKNLVNRGSNSINFQLSISKICNGEESPQMQQKLSNTSSDKFMRSSRVSGYLSPPQMPKTLQFPSFMSSFKKQSNHMKTTSDVEWTQHQYNEQPKKQMQSSCSQKGEEMSLKSICRKQFQISTLNELSALFMNRQSIYEQFNLSEDILRKNKRIVTNYIFRQNQIEIGISVISQGSRKYLEKAISIEISQAFNVQFNSRKQAYQTTCITQNFSTSNMPKSSTKLGQDIPKQTYHKILLFLFTHFDTDTQKTKVASPSILQLMNGKEHNKFIQAVQQWRMKDEDINITEKLSKEYVLIKQEVQNEKSSFKNKLKIFEAIIGESVNVEKLLNEEKEIENNTTLSPNTINQAQKPISGTINDINLCVSLKSQLKSMLNSPPPQQLSAGNSEFKRLKQSFQMIRNIDNVINQQTKKIETLKKYLKEVVKQKDQNLNKHARSLNQIKKQIKTIKEEIQEKKLQFQFRTDKSQVENIQKQRNFAPTNKAQEILADNVKLFHKIMQNQRTNKNNQKFSFSQDPYLQTHNKQNLQKTLKHNQKTSYDIKKQFLIRKQHKSFYNQGSEKLNSTNQTSYKGKVCVSPTLLETISSETQNTQEKLLKKRQQQVQNRNLWMNVYMQQNKRTQSQNDCDKWSNQRQKDILLTLYRYYLKNIELMNKTKAETKGSNGFKHQDINTTIGSNSRPQVFNNLSRKGLQIMNSRTKTSNWGKQKSQIKNLNYSAVQASSNSINLQLYPLLNSIINPRISESAFQAKQCSIISDSISQVGAIKQSLNLKDLNSGQKRITLDKMFQKK